MLAVTSSSSKDALTNTKTAFVRIELRYLFSKVPQAWVLTKGEEDQESEYGDSLVRSLHCETREAFASSVKVIRAVQRRSYSTVERWSQYSLSIQPGKDPRLKNQVNLLQHKLDGPTSEHTQGFSPQNFQSPWICPWHCHVIHTALSQHMIWQFRVLYPQELSGCHRSYNWKFVQIFYERVARICGWGCWWREVYLRQWAWLC